MANPANLTITTLAENGSVARPAGSAIDTNGTVPILAGSDTGRLMVEVTNSAAANLTVAIKAGVNPPALRASLGDVSATLAQNAVQVFGPFESARFAQGNGDVNVSFTAATSTPTATVRVYKLPKM